MRLILSLGLALGALLIFEGASSRRPKGTRIPGLLVRAHPAVTRAAIGLTLGGVVAAATSLPAGSAVGLLVWWIPSARDEASRRAIECRRREQWPDAISALIASLRAGRSLAESCVALETRGGPSLRPGFEAFASTYRATGSFDLGMTAMAERLEDPVGDRVAVALTTAHDVGGTDLIRVLGTLADFIRDDLRIRREVEARWSWTVTAARLSAGAPWVVLALMWTQPEAARAYASETGTLILFIGALATFFGYRSMLRVARLPEERRLR